MGKKYLVKQTVDYNQKGLRTATFTVQSGSEGEALFILDELDGKVEVYELNAALSRVDANVNSISMNIVDSIRFISPIAKTVYVSAYNRPIVFKSSTNLESLMVNLKGNVDAFGDLHPGVKASDVSFDYGNQGKL